MHPFAQSTLLVAMRRLDNALALLEEHADGGKDCFGEAYAELRKLRDDLHAIDRLEEMAEIAEKADTQPAPHLRVVR